MYKWEELPTAPACPELCPWTVLQKYVQLTASFVPKGSQVFISLQPPFSALSANTLGSITKKALARYNISPDWGPHSTRGAGVQLYKSLGLSSEEVCQLGVWKNVQSFTSHYLRLNAASRAVEALTGLVHNSSLGGSAEPELSRTPGNFGDPGGRDNKGEARKTSEVMLFFAAFVFRVFFALGRSSLRGFVEVGGARWR